MTDRPKTAWFERQEAQWGRRAKHLTNCTDLTKFGQLNYKSRKHSRRTPSFAQAVAEARASINRS